MYEMYDRNDAINDISLKISNVKLTSMAFPI